MMFGRKRSLRQQADIERGEHVVADAKTLGDVVVATERALYVGGERLPWTSITHATWAAPILDLDVDRPGHLRPERLRLELDPAGEVPAAVFAQVTASIVATHRLVLGPSSGAQATARRGEDGQIHWTVRFDDGLDPHDPTLRAEAEAALSSLRESLGI